MFLRHQNIVRKKVPKPRVLNCLAMTELTLCRGKNVINNIIINRIGFNKNIMRVHNRGREGRG